MRRGIQGSKALLIALAVLLPALALAGGADGVVVEGQPPLTQQMLKQTDEFVAWLVDSPLTAEQQAKIEQSVMENWRTHDANGMKGILDSLTLREKLWQLPQDQREVVHQKILPQVLTELRKEQATDETAKWMVAIYDAAHQPLAEGTPPLTRQMTDAYAEMMFFMLSQVSGQHLEATRTVKDEWAKSLARDYPKMTPAAQAKLAKMPLLAAAMRAEWSKLTKAQRDQYRKRWRGLVEQVWHSRPPVAARAGSASDSSAAHESPEEALRKVQAQQRAFHSLSSMSMQTHYTMINAMNAMSGNPYRYVNSYGSPY